MANAPTLGQRLRDHRRHAGLSQTALAQRCGIPKPRLSRYENDHIVPSIDSLQRLTHALGVSPAAILDPCDEPLQAFMEELRAKNVCFQDVEHARAVAAELCERLSRREPEDVRIDLVESSA